MGITKIDNIQFVPVLSFSPLSIIARLLVFYLIFIRGVNLIDIPFLPFLSFLDVLRDLEWIYPIVNFVYLASILAILFGFKFQKFSLILSLLIFFQILSSKGVYSTSFLYSGCMLFLIGLYNPALEWTFRLQIALLYLGAGSNKLFDLDWLSGQYFENFLLNVYPNSFNITLSSWLGVGFFTKMLSYSVIATELLLVIWAISARKQSELVICIIAFHLSILVFTFGKLSIIYMYLMTVTSFLLLPIKTKNLIFSPRKPI